VKILGMILIFSSAVLFSYYRNRSAGEKILLIEELFGFIRQARLDIGCYLRPIGEISFESEKLSACGFFSDIEEFGVWEAYLRLEKKLSLSEKERAPLRRFFSFFGKGYAEDEIKLIDTALSELAEIIKVRRENEEKSRKLTLTLSCAASLAFIILLL